MQQRYALPALVERAGGVVSAWPPSQCLPCSRDLHGRSVVFERLLRRTLPLLPLSALVLTHRDQKGRLSPRDIVLEQTNKIRRNTGGQLSCRRMEQVIQRRYNPPTNRRTCETPLPKSQDMDCRTVHVLARREEI